PDRARAIARGRADDVDLGTGRAGPDADARAPDALAARGDGAAAAVLRVLLARQVSRDARAHRLASGALSGLVLRARPARLRAGRIGRAAFERAPSSIAGELHDSISLLWRLELVGQPVGARWAPFTAIARERVNRMGLLFHAAHVAMALAGGGEWATAKAHLE